MQTIRPTYLDGQIIGDDIGWSLESIPPLETVPHDTFDLVHLPLEELAVYAADLRGEVAALRTTLHETLTVVHRQTKQIQQYQARTIALIAELRQANDAVRALHVELRALQDRAA